MVDIVKGFAKIDAGLLLKKPLAVIFEEFFGVYFASSITIIKGAGIQHMQKPKSSLFPFINSDLRASGPFSCIQTQQKMKSRLQ